MLKTVTLLPGITLRCFQDTRFKQGCMSIQLVRKMCREEAALNALLPAVLLRGTANTPDLRDITLRLDDLYGASVGALVRRIGDFQTTGLSCGFIDDRFALEGDQILEPMIEFLGEILLDPLLENGIFDEDYTESEKVNLISTIESQLNHKQSYANSQMLKLMCREDSFGIPRLGEADQVKAITAGALYAHYRRILRESPVEVFYAGSAEPDRVAELLLPLFSSLDRQPAVLPKQTAFRSSGENRQTEQMEISQGKLSMGFSTPITIQDPRLAAMQLCNMIFGGGMTSKLFMQVREQMSLCYDISSGYHGSKGIITVSAGIDPEKEELVYQEILKQLDACARGNITEQELTAAKQAVLSSLRGTHDSPGAIEGYYATAALSGLSMTPADYARAIDGVTLEQVAEAAKTVTLNTVYFLKGVE